MQEETPPGFIFCTKEMKNSRFGDGRPRYHYYSNELMECFLFCLSSLFFVGFHIFLLLLLAVTKNKVWSHKVWSNIFVRSRIWCRLVKVFLKQSTAFQPFPHFFPASPLACFQSYIWSVTGWNTENKAEGLTCFSK